ncbi:MAG: glycerol kinase GlpK [Acidimicrobiales bacterium]
MASRAPVTVAVDAGTTGVRALVVDQRARVVDLAYRELTQYFPQPGWVEHDPDEIWSTVQATLGEVAGRLGDRDLVVTALGVTNQRETVVAWDKRSGRPLARAIVWQDRRTASDCQALADEGHLPLVRQRTGLVLDPYFSATKMRWLLREGGVALDSGLALGTVDAWVLWNLTGGADGGVFATDVTNASRTMLYDIVERRWSAELSQLFDIPLSVLPDVGPSSGRFGRIASSVLGADSALSGVPVSAMAGDQHAALFGQACFESGMTKVTIGTGSFVLMNAGSSSPAPVEGLITTVAWDLGGATVDHGAPPPAGDGGFAYALEGSVFASGAGAQWLRDGLGLFEEMAELEPLADSVASSEGVVVVPAFTGLGSPNWDPDARGTIVGLSRGSGRAQLARAMVEAMAFQVRDVLDAMAATGITPSLVRVDGGASVMALLLQLTADQTGLEVLRPVSTETTAIGVATMAGLAEGTWTSLGELAELWTCEVAHRPVVPRDLADAAHETWLRALDRSGGWASTRKS